MEYRRLGKNNLQVSEIGFGGEWLERHEESESVALLKYAHSRGINMIDCWMPDPKSRDIIGQAIGEDHAGWIVQGHIGSTYQNGQYTRTRDAEQCRIAFEDLLARLKTDSVDLGMIHYADREKDWEVVIYTQLVNKKREFLSIHQEGYVPGFTLTNPSLYISVFCFFL